MTAGHPRSKTLQNPPPRIDNEDYTRAILNILEDFAGEKARLEDAQRAMLNLLEDFDMEREKAEAVNRELRNAERQITRSLQEKEALLREIHHRVKNNLQVICSMLNLQLPFIRDEKAIEIFKECQSRIYSMALIHEKLYLSETLTRIDFSEYIKSLISHLFLSYGKTERTVRPVIHVKDVSLGIEKVIPCALIINELASNSLKHAFPSQTLEKTPEIRISFLSEGDELVLKVSDNGIGMPKAFRIQDCESLGLKLVNALVHQLGGDMMIRSHQGTEFVIRFSCR